MNDDELFALIKRVDPRAVRIPPGVRKIADEIERAVIARQAEAHVPDIAADLGMNQHTDAKFYLRAALDWIDAIPKEVADALPAMPGFDRDAAESAIKGETYGDAD